MKLTQGQIEHLIRWALSAGGPLAAWLIAHNYATQPQVDALMTTLLWLIAAAPPAASFVWGLISHTVSGQVAEVEKMPGAKITVDATAGPELKAIANDPTRPKVTPAPPISRLS